MPKNTVIALGILVAVMPFVGIPGAWKTPLYFLFGSGIAIASYQLQYRKKVHVVRHAGTRKPRAQGHVAEHSLEAQQPAESLQAREESSVKNS